MLRLAFYVGFVVWLSWASLSCLPALDEIAAPQITSTPDNLATFVGQITPTQLATLRISVAFQNSPEPSQTPTVTPITPTPDANSTTVSCPPTINDNPRPQYKIEAQLNWVTHEIQADQQVIYTNQTGQAQQELVFQVEPNRFTGLFTLQGITASDNSPIDEPELELTRLTVPLSDPLEVGCQISLNLSFHLQIPPVVDGYDGRLGYWGFTERQINLGHWFPMLAPFRADEWLVPRPHLVGEQITAESSDFEVVLHVAEAPPTLDVAGAGIVTVIDRDKWQFTLQNGRDLTISLGNGYRRASQLADDGTLVELYYYPDTDPEGFKPAPQVLQAAVDSLLLYEELFGMEYPFERLVIVQGDFPDGMEFSGLVFVSEAWFRTWDGLPNSWLTIITVHEVSHQWWYNLVGNDPANYPYMDEAFATYSEYLYFQRYYGDLTEWWWNYRVRGHDLSQSVVDAPVYRYDTGRAYVNGSYLLGAQMLHTMRTDLGDQGFFAWLQSFMQTYAYEIASPQDFWGLLSPTDYAESLAVRQRFLEQWEILPTVTPEIIATP